MVTKSGLRRFIRELEALQAQDIADTVVYVTSQPRRVQITDMTIMANQQATGFMVHKN